MRSKMLNPALSKVRWWARTKAIKMRPNMILWSKTIWFRKERIRKLGVWMSGVCAISKLARKKKLRLPSLTHYTLIHNREKLVQRTTFLISVYGNKRNIPNDYFIWRQNGENITDGRAHTQVKGIHLLIFFQSY